MSDRKLPEAFADLEPYAGWSLESELERSGRRRGSSLEELRAFYAAAIERVPAALAYLNEFPIADLGGRERKLMYLCLSFAEVAPFVEQYRRTVLPEVFDETRMEPVHDSYRPS